MWSMPTSGVSRPCACTWGGVVMRRTMGVALRCSNFGNTSQVVHLLTPGHGSWTCSPRGVEASEPMFGGGFDVAGRTNSCTSAHARSLASSPSPGGRVPRRLARDRAGPRTPSSCSRSRVLRRAGERDERLYGLVTAALRVLDAGAEDALLEFLRAGLDNAGFLPCLDRCVQCGAPPWDAGATASAARRAASSAAAPAEADLMIPRAVAAACAGGAAPPAAARDSAVRFFIDWTNHVLAFRRRVLEYPSTWAAGSEERHRVAAEPSRPGQRRRRAGVCVAAGCCGKGFRDGLP